MARFCGKIGFAVSAENPVGSGRWSETVTERTYYGDVTRDSWINQGGDKVVQDVNISNSFSIIADAYMKANLGVMRYVKYGGMAWKIDRVEILYPRINLTVGGVYNGPVAT